MRGLTGRGGLHLLYTYPAELHVPSIALESRGYPGIECKADGGYIVCPPSVHPDEPQAVLLGGRLGSRARSTSRRRATRCSSSSAPRAGGARGTSGHWRALDLDDAGDLDPRDVECARILIEHFGGHDPVRLGDGTLALWRPGKTERESHSVTIGFIAPGVAKFWTDMWPPFAQGQVVDLGQLKAMAGIGPKIEIPELDFELPDGYRLWRDGDDVVPDPVLGRAAYHRPGRRVPRPARGPHRGAPGRGRHPGARVLGTIIGRRAVVPGRAHRAALQPVRRGARPVLRGRQGCRRCRGARARRRGGSFLPGQALDRRARFR